MPVYKEITKEMLDDWLNYLINGFGYLSDSLDYDCLKLYTLSLYEYIQCLCRFNNSDCVNLKKVKVTVRDIKSGISSDEYSNIISKMHGLRNLIGHGNNDVTKVILSLFSNPAFYELLTELQLDFKLINSIKDAIHIFSSITDIESKCLFECRSLVKEWKGSSRNVAELVGKLYNKYPKVIVEETFLNVIGTHVIV